MLVLYGSTHGRGITLNWQGNSDYYEVFSPTGLAYTTQGNSFSTTVDRDGRFSYLVYGYTEKNESVNIEVSNTVELSIATYSPPMPILSMTAQHLLVTLRWTSVAGGVKYDIIRNGERLAITTDTHYTDTLEDGGGVFRYQVRAQNTLGVWSQYSAAQVYKYETGPLIAPTLRVLVNGLAATLSWNLVSRADEFEVQRNGKSIGFTTSTNFNDILEDTGDFVYRVRALSAYVEKSPWSDPRFIIAEHPSLPQSGKRIVAVSFSWQEDPGASLYELRCNENLIGYTNANFYSGNIEATPPYVFKYRSEVNGNWGPWKIAYPPSVVTAEYNS